MADSTEATRASRFDRFEARDVVDLVAEYPLAWVQGICNDAPPSLLPLLLETDESGKPEALLGHMARRNPLFSALEADGRVLVLFTGPQAYVPTSLVSDPSWAPTWNYTQLRIHGRVDFLRGGVPEALERLGDAMGETARGWRQEDVGARYDSMVRAIVAFRVTIDRLEGRFKLGQDEKPERLEQILSGHADAALVRWMRRFNQR